ncbi:Ig-like domain-containing protein, partial [Euryarchaeota archaeon]|nr:Ig-like domain-containing protein [Euryarchaeota archaeon]
MVAAMPLQNDARPSEKTVSLRDLRRVAFGLTAAIMIVMIAGAISEDSGSVSASELGESSTANYVTIGVSDVAGDDVVLSAEATAGFTVSGTSDQTSATITVVYSDLTNSASDTCTSHASTGAWSCNFQSGAGAGGNMASVVDGNIRVTATVTVGGSDTVATIWAQQDTLVPTMTITASQGADGFMSTDSALSLTFTASQATSNFVAGDISVSNGAISSFAATSTQVYTATFTPTAAGPTTIDVLAGAFTDALGNPNTAATQFNWAYDDVSGSPSMVITASQGADG